MSTPAPARGIRDWVALAVLILPVLVIAVVATVINLALPFISAALAPTSVELLWMVDIYSFVLAGLLLVMGNLGDRIGRRRLLLIGTVLLGLSLVGSAFAGTAWLLVLCRAGQGVAAAAVLPSTLSLIRTIFPDGPRRRAAIAVWAGAFSAGGALGPLVGGLLLGRLPWGAVFVVLVPLLIPPLVFGWRLLPEYRDPTPAPFNLASAGLFLAAVLPVIYGVKSIAAYGFHWSDVVFVVIGVGMGLAFGWRQRQLDEPMLDLGLFRNSAFSAALLCGIIGMFALFGVFFFIGQYLQLVLGMDPLLAALWTLPAAAMAGLGSAAAAVLVKWRRPGSLIGGGMTLAAVGFGFVTLARQTAGLIFVTIGLALVGCGTGVVQTLSSDIGMASGSTRRAGAVSAVLESGNELGGALGVAVLGSMGAAAYRRGVIASAPVGVPPLAVHVAQQTLGDAVSVATRLGGVIGARLLHVARTAFTDGMHYAAVVGAVVMIVGAALAVVVLNLTARRRPEPSPPSDLPQPTRLPTRQEHP